MATEPITIDDPPNQSDSGAKAPAEREDLFLSGASFWVPDDLEPSPWLDHAPFASWVVGVHRPRVLVQIGVERDQSYHTFCQAVDRLGLDTQCFGIDRFASEQTDGFYGPELLAQLRATHDPRFGTFSSLVASRLVEAAQEFDDASVDLLHIGSSARDSDLIDALEAWSPKMSGRAVIIVGDTRSSPLGDGRRQVWGDLSSAHPSFEFSHGRGIGIVAFGRDTDGAVAALCAVDPVGPEGVAIRRAYERLGSGLTANAEELQLRAEFSALESSIDRKLARVDDGNRRDRAASDAVIAELRAQVAAQNVDLERERRAASDLVGERERQHAIQESTDSDLDDLNDDKERLQAQLATAKRRAKANTESAAASQKRLKKQLHASQRKYARLRNRRVVRLALRLADVFQPLFRFVRGSKKRGPKGSAAATPVQQQRRSESKTVKSLLAERPSSGATAGPPVTIVMLTRDGAEHLERVLTGLRDRTMYRSFDLIVVDNGSTDNSAEVLGRDWGFPIAVVRNDRNESFSKGCNQGIAAAEGDYVLLLNNDIDPINATWLGLLVEAMENDPSVGAAGALLVYPAAPEGATDEDIELELTVQHRGIGFRWSHGTPVGFNLGLGDDPVAAELAETVAVPGVTAACMLVRTDRARSIRGLDERYVYGSEDVDLNLRLGDSGGSIVLVGGAALFHHEFGTQSAYGAQRRRAYRSSNRQVFAESWSPRLSRTLHRDALDGGDVPWRGHTGRTVAITLTANDPSGGWGDWYTAHELGDAFEALGWAVVYAEAYKKRWLDLPTDVDLVISLLDRYDVRTAPAGAVTVAWIRNWTDRWIEQPWIGAFDALVPSSEISFGLLEKAGLAPRGILPLATNPDRFHKEAPNAVFQSDYVFTGNHWGKNRSILAHLDVAPGEHFSIFGKGWEDVGRASRYWRGSALYDDLPSVYSAAKIVLDDTAGPTLPYGAINSRVFDALACGTLVLTDNGAGSKEFFEGVLPSYTGRDDLRELLDTYLADDDLRNSTAAALQSMVLAEHTYAKRAEQFVAIAAEHAAAPRVAFKIGPPSHEEAELWGDTHFARAFASSLERTGWSTRIDILPEWDSLETQAVDVAVHIRGLVPYVPKPGQLNVLWIISHPADVPDAECERFDLVLVASHSHAATLSERLSVPVRCMLQATAFDTVIPPHGGDEGDAAIAADVLFVGNSRGVMRPSVEYSLEKGIPVEVYGSGWEGIVDPAVVHGEHIENRHLSHAYRSARVVLNDHWDEMREYGFISNRVFDVLASGGFVVTDDVSGIADVFGDCVPTYEDADDLQRLVAYFLEHPDERARLVEAGSDIVAQQHTFDRRAEEFNDFVKPMMAGRPCDLLGGTF